MPKKERAEHFQLKGGAVVDKNLMTPPFPEILESAIIDLAAGVKKLARSRLKQETIVTLLHDHAKVSKRDIRIILQSLDDLEGLFLKPKAKST